MSAASPVLRHRWRRGWFACLLAGGAVILARADAPPPPTNLNAHSGGDKEVALSWSASPGAASYTIFRSTTQNDTGIKQVAENVTETSYKATGLRNDLTYYFRVKAVGPGGTSAFSGETSATTLITKQALPEGVYTLAPKSAPQLRLDATVTIGGGVASVAAKSAAPTQQWRLRAVGLRTYELSALGAATLGQWTLAPVAGGYRLAPAHAATLALNASGAGDGDAVTAAPVDGSAAQVWNILPIAESAPDPGTAHVPTGYKLVFGDEFNGDKIDLTKWETLAPYSQPHLNDELENYLAEAVTIKDGYCVLTAEPHEAACLLAGKEPAPHCKGVHHWRSGAITSRSTRTHGYYEARFKIPQGQGLWPAFWLTSSTRWPPEWDIVEIPNTVGTLYQYPHPTRRGTLKNVGGLAGPDSIYAAADGMPNPYDGYVVYGCEVTPTFVKMWVNGKLTIHWEVTGDTIDPMWVSLNLAVGGKWPGPPDATTPKRNDMLIDYVRVYQSSAVEAEVKAMLAAEAGAAEPKK